MSWSMRGVFLHIKWSRRRRRGLLALHLRRRRAGHGRGILRPRGGCHDYGKEDGGNKKGGDPLKRS
jgi:hypothetical protein